jgi:hypothetical protein
MMTIFQRRVLVAVSHNEYTGVIEPAMEMYGYPSHLEMYNVQRAFDRLVETKHIDPAGPVLTQKGHNAIQVPK